MQQPPDTAPTPPWHRLRFAASGLTGSVQTTLTVSPASMADLAARPYATLADTPGAFTASYPLLLQVDGEVRTVFGSSGTQARVWFDADNGQALLRERIRTGSEGSSKLHRFGASGASRLRLEPDSSRQARLPATEWTRRERKFHHYDLQQAGCSDVTLPVLLLYGIAREPTRVINFVSHCKILSLGQCFVSCVSQEIDPSHC